MRRLDFGLFSTSCQLLLKRTPYGGAFGLWTFFHFLSNKINKNLFHCTSCVVFSEPAILFGGSDLVSSTKGPPSCIYLNKPVARDALTFRPLLVARGTRDIHEPLRALFFPPITSQDFGQVIVLDQSQCNIQTRLNSPGGPTLLLTMSSLSCTVHDARARSCKQCNNASCSTQENERNRS